MSAQTALPGHAGVVVIGGHLPTLSDQDARLYIRDAVGGLLVGCFEARIMLYVEASALRDEGHTPAELDLARMRAR